MDVGLVGAGILSGVLGAHIATMLRERLSLGTWIDSVLGVLGGGFCAHLATLLNATWVDTSPGFAIGRIAAVVTIGILGGAGLLLIAGLFRPRRSALRNDQNPVRDRSATSPERRRGDRRLSENDL